MKLLTEHSRSYLEAALASTYACEARGLKTNVLAETSDALGLPEAAHLGDDKKILYAKFHDGLVGFYPILDATGRLGAFVHHPETYAWRLAA